VNRAPVSNAASTEACSAGSRTVVKARVDEHEMPSTAVLRDDHDMSAQIGRDGVPPADAW
jgi:hypothetical protein